MPKINDVNIWVGYMIFMATSARGRNKKKSLVVRRTNYIGIQMVLSAEPITLVFRWSCLQNQLHWYSDGPANAEMVLRTTSTLKQQNIHVEFSLRTIVCQIQMVMLTFWSSQTTEGHWTIDYTHLESCQSWRPRCRPVLHPLETSLVRTLDPYRLKCMFMYQYA